MCVSASVMSIIQSMTSSPPELGLIQDICHFLLAVHPAANTYISHSRSVLPSRQHLHLTLKVSVTQPPTLTSHTQGQCYLAANTYISHSRSVLPGRQHLHLTLKVSGVFVCVCACVCVFLIPVMIRLNLWRKSSLICILSVGNLLKPYKIPVSVNLLFYVSHVKALREFH